MEETEIQNEFSRVLNVADAAKAGTIDIHATAEELEALNERFGFDKIEAVSLKGTVKAVPNSDDFVLNATVSGIVHVEYETGDKEKLDLAEDVEIYLLANLPEDEDEFEGDFELIEEDGSLDFGEIAAQYISLIVDPWEALESMEALFEMMGEEDGEEGKVNPFKELREKLEEEAKKQAK